MENIKAFVKRHGWTIAAVAIVAIGLLVLMARRGGGGGSAGVPSQSNSDPLAAAQLSAQTQLALAGMQLQGQQAAVQGQIAIEGQRFAADYALQTHLGDQNFALQQQGQQLEAALATLQINTNAQLSQNQINAALTSQAMQLQSNFDILSLQTEANLHIADTLASTQMGLAQIQANTTTTLADYNRQVQTAQINAADRANRRSNNSSMLGSVLGFVGGLFSDERLKEDIRLEGVRADGVEIVSWRFKGERQRWRGVIAQQVQRIYPAAVREVRGLLAVNYDLIGVQMVKA